MNCNPADYYPFAKYNLWSLALESAVSLSLILLGVLAYINRKRREKAGKPVTPLRQIGYVLLFFLGVVGINLFISRVPKTYAYYKLSQNYREGQTTLLSVDFNSSYANIEKYVVKHKTTVGAKEMIQETSVYNETIRERLRTNKSANQLYWIYYNPDDPDVYLVDFSGTVDKHKPICK